MSEKTVRLVVTMSYDPDDYRLAYGMDDTDAPTDMRAIVTDSIATRWALMDWGRLGTVALVEEVGALPARVPSGLYHDDGTVCAGSDCVRVHDRGHRFDRLTAFHTDVSMRDSAGCYRTMIVTVDEPGYHPGPVIAADSPVGALEFVRQMNANLGVTEEMARNIVASSMFGAPYAGLSSR